MVALVFLGREGVRSLTVARLIGVNPKQSDSQASSDNDIDGRKLAEIIRSMRFLERPKRLYQGRVPLLSE
jgi:hypothetical protein